MTHADDKTTSRPQAPDPSAATKQAKEDALSPADKHKNYLADLERAHAESVVDSTGHTPRAG